MNIDIYELKNACVGLFGVLLLIFGTRLYRYTIITPGALFGAYVGVVLTLGQSQSIQLFGIGLCSVIGVVLMLLVEKLAIALSCALVGGAITQYALPYYFGFPLDWYWVIVGSVLGGIFFAPFFPKLLPFWMSLAGAGCVTWAVNQPRNVEWLIGLSLLGTIYQRSLGTKVTDFEES